MCWNSAITIRWVSKNITSSDHRGFRRLNVSAIRLCSRANRMCNAVNEISWFALPSPIRIGICGEKYKFEYIRVTILHNFTANACTYQQRSMILYLMWHRILCPKSMATIPVQSHPASVNVHHGSYGPRFVFVYRHHILRMHQRNALLCSA